MNIFLVTYYANNYDDPYYGSWKQATFVNEKSAIKYASEINEDDYNEDVVVSAATTNEDGMIIPDYPVLIFPEKDRCLY